MSALPPIIDLRAASSDSADELGVLESLRLPYYDLSDRSMELPARKTPFVVLFDGRDAGCASTAAKVADDFADDVRETLDVAAPGDTWLNLRMRGYTVGTGVRGAATLWNPSPLMPEAVAAVRTAWAARAADASCVRWLLDAGSGTGRNAVYLCRQFEAPAAASSAADALPSVGRFCVAGVDNRRAMVEKLEKFASREGLLGRSLVPAQRDIASFWKPEPAIPRGLHSGAAAPERSGALPGLSDSVAAAAAEPVLLPPRTFAGYDGALFMRFTHKEAFVQLGRQLHAAAAEAAAAASCPEASCHRPPFVLVVECFHVSSEHPKAADQKLELGETLQLVTAAEREAASAAAGAGSSVAAVESPGSPAVSVAPSAGAPSRWRVLLERVCAIEDGRPIVHALLECDWAGGARTADGHAATVGTSR
jgi:hypothetical protein